MFIYSGSVWNHFFLSKIRFFFKTIDAKCYMLFAVGLVCMMIIKMAQYESGVAVEGQSKY